MVGEYGPWLKIKTKRTTNKKKKGGGGTLKMKVFCGRTNVGVRGLFGKHAGALMDASRRSSVNKIKTEIRMICKKR